MGAGRALPEGQKAKSPPTCCPSKLSKPACSCCPVVGGGLFQPRLSKGPKYPEESITGQGVVSPGPGLPRAASVWPGAAAPAPSRRGAPSPPWLGSRPPGHSLQSSRPPSSQARPPPAPPSTPSELGAPSAPATLPLGGPSSFVLGQQLGRLPPQSSRRTCLPFPYFCVSPALSVLFAKFQALPFHWISLVAGF